VDVVRLGESLPVDEQHQLAALAPLGGTDVGTPFFADATVASAMAVRQSIRPRASSLCITRRHASSKTPASIHSPSRRQPVGYDGKQVGKSLHRATDLSTHRMPSRQRRGANLGRPHVGRSTNRSLIRCHCPPVSSAARTVLAPVRLRPRAARSSRVMTILWSPFGRPRHATRLPIRTITSAFRHCF
jgi:hypothetical protein